MLDGVASFKNKRSYLQMKWKDVWHAYVSHLGWHNGYYKLPYRENVLESSLRLLHHTPTEDIDADRFVYVFMAKKAWMLAGWPRIVSRGCQTTTMMVLA